MSLSVGGTELGWPAALEVPKHRKRRRKSRKLELFGAGVYRPSSHYFTVEVRWYRTASQRDNAVRSLGSNQAGWYKEPAFAGPVSRWPRTRHG